MHRSWPLFCWLLGSLVGLGQSSPAQAMQRTREQAAFLQARSVTEPAARVQALDDFRAHDSGSAMGRRAAELELETLLASFPERTAAIHALAFAAVQSAAPGFERWSEEARQADHLASAGADLPDAEAWAKDAVTAMTEEAYRHAMRATELKYKLPALSASQRHQDFARTRAVFLAALANVDLRRGDATGAAAPLAEAGRLDPLLSEVSSLEGQRELLRHEDRAALADFERAEAEGDLQQPWLDTMVALYKQQNNGSQQRNSASGSSPELPQTSVAAAHEAASDLPPGLSAEIDALYSRLFPPPFALPPRELSGRHTVLLELFTGSGCEPCRAPDLAVESLLATYRRQDLAVLEYDEHIPRPDPLANPDTLERAARYNLQTTPQAFLDGTELPVLGATRADVENVVVSFADALEDRAAVDSGWQLTLQVGREAGATVVARAGLERRTVPAPVQARTGIQAGEPVASVSRRPPLVHFALVEDHVRYSGENGIRFHRMVVRALSPAASATPAPGAGSPSAASRDTGEATFEPAQIEARQAAYLDRFEKENDRFGEVSFRAKPVAMRPDHLAVVSWLEDAGSHTVLQAAYAEVPAP